MNLFNFQDAFEEKKQEEKTLNGITNRKIKIRTKIKFNNKLKKEAIDKLITELPGKDESLHMVSNGSFDYFNIIPRVIDLTGKKVDEFYFSTWTMSHLNVVQILDLFDKGIIKNINALTGEYFRTRESAVYHILELGIKERNQFLFANKNHSKVTLMQIEDDYFSIEGSANFTANPRIEQFILTNSKELFLGHKDWMDTLLKKNK